VVEQACPIVDRKDRSVRDRTAPRGLVVGDLGKLGGHDSTERPGYQVREISAVNAGRERVLVGLDYMGAHGHSIRDEEISLDRVRQYRKDSRGRAESNKAHPELEQVAGA
jgi:hypothetical protein